MTTRYEMALAHATSLNIRYTTISFPMKHVEDGTFEFANGEILKFSELGAGYLSEKVRTTSYATFTELFREEKYDEIANIVNANLSIFKPVYQVALFDDEIVGIMSNYNPVSHQSLLETIEKAGLSANLTTWSSCQTHMDFYVLVGARSRNGLLVYLKIRNGHSGHYALNYNLVLKADGYEWKQPATYLKRRRHLSKVQEVVDALKEAMDQCETVKLDDALMAEPVEKTIDWWRSNVTLTVRQEHLIDACKAGKPANTLELIVILGQYASTPGYHNAVSCLIDPLLNKIRKEV